MKKFKDILNENNDGIYDNKKSVSLIVKDYDLIRKEMLPIIEDKLNYLNEGHKIIYQLSDNSFKTTIIQNHIGEYEIKYLSIIFNISDTSLNNTEIDISEFFFKAKENLSKILKIKDDKIIQGSASHQYMFKIDYQDFKHSNYFKASKTINKFNL